MYDAVQAKTDIRVSGEIKNDIYQKSFFIQLIINQTNSVFMNFYILRNGEKFPVFLYTNPCYDCLLLTKST